MGAYLSEPVKDYEDEAGKDEKFNYAATCVQGWRIHQEDAKNCILDFLGDKQAAFFGVYDGHGGCEVSKYTALHFPEFIKSRISKLSDSDSLGEIMQQLFLDFDAHLKEDAAMKEMRVFRDENKNKDEEDGLENGRPPPADPEDVDDDDDDDDELSGDKKYIALEQLCKEAGTPLEDILKRYGFPIPLLFGTRSEKLAKFQSPKVAKRQKQTKEESNGEVVKEREVPIIVEEENLEKQFLSDCDDSPKEQNGDDNLPADKTLGTADTGVEVKDKNKNQSEQDPSPITEDPKPGSKRKQPDLDCNLQNEEEISPSDSKEVPEVKRKKSEQPHQEKNNSEKPKEPSDSDDEASLSSSENDEDYVEGFEEDDDEEEEDLGFPSSSESGDSSGNEAHLGDELEEDEILSEEEQMVVCNSDGDADSEDYLDVPTGDTPATDSGTTACVTLILGDTICVANVGDSRAVLCRNGFAVDLSEDHKPEDDSERARIQKAGGRITADGRVNGGLNLSRALGDHFYKSNDKVEFRDQMITSLPDIKMEKLQDEDEFLVVACDGIWNSMSSQEVVEFVKDRVKSGTGLQQICHDLCDYCLAPNTDGDGTGCDNMTVVIVTFVKQHSDVVEVADQPPPQQNDTPENTLEDTPSE